MTQSNDKPKQKNTFSHNSYLVYDNDDVITDIGNLFLKKVGQDDVSFFDKVIFDVEVLGIEDARNIKIRASKKSFKKDSYTLYIIRCGSVTSEAQNALLKLFEEPPELSLFFLVIPKLAHILPTLKSRLEILEFDFKTEYLDVSEFISLNLSSRLEFIKDYDKKNSVILLDSLIKFFHKDVNGNLSRLKALLLARKYIGDKSASVKQILEYVAMSL